MPETVLNRFFGLDHGFHELLTWADETIDKAIRQLHDPNLDVLQSGPLPNPGLGGGPPRYTSVAGERDLLRAALEVKCRENFETQARSCSPVGTQHLKNALRQRFVKTRCLALGLLPRVQAAPKSKAKMMAKAVGKAVPLQGGPVAKSPPFPPKGMAASSGGPPPKPPEAEGSDRGLAAAADERELRPLKFDELYGSKRSSTRESSWTSYGWCPGP